MENLFESRVRLLVVFVLLFGPLALTAQTRAVKLQGGTIPALFLSDVHYDPLRDPALAPRLNAAPAAEWAAILATPASATLAEDAAAVKKACPVRGDDPDQTLWQSSLTAMRAAAGPGSAAPARFMVLTGDLLPHNFTCRYTFLFPNASHTDFVNFAEKTLRYVIGSLREAMPGIPLYAALGNNDTACKGNSLDPDDEFLHLTAKVVAEMYPEQERAAMLRDVAAGGYYSVLPQAHSPMPHTRIVVVDDLFFLTEYTTCAGKKEYTEEPRQIAWLNRQLDEARRRHETVWVLGHIPPGVSLYGTFTQKQRNICAGDAPVMSLDTERMAEAIAAHADVVRLAVFAHTHSDAFGLLRPGLGGVENAAQARLGAGVPMKVVASISAVNGNKPSFMVATLNAATATLEDYTVIEASNLTGRDAVWTKQYRFSEDYKEPDFSGASLKGLIADFRADPSGSGAKSQAYLDNHYSTSAPKAVLQQGWPLYPCAMDHDTGASFAACVCAAGVVPPAR